MPADPRRVKDLFAATLDLPEGPARAAFLDRECGDDGEFRRWLEALCRPTTIRPPPSPGR